MTTTPKTILLCFFTAGMLMAALPVGSAQVNPMAADQTQHRTSNAVRLRALPGQFAIQVGAYQQLARAEDELSRLVTKGLKPFYRYEDTGTKGMWFRVYADSFDTKLEAREAAGRMQQASVIHGYMIRQLDENGDFRFAPDTLAKDPLPTGRAPEVKEADVARRSSAQKKQDAQTRTAEIAPPAKDNAVRTASETDPALVRGTATGSTPVPLSLLDAIRLSLEGNREIQVVSYTPKQALENVANSESVYDPFLFADASYSRDPNLESSVTDIVTEDELLTQTGIRKPLETGGTLSTYFETRYSDLNNAQFDRSYKHIAAPTVELRQPLLNNIGAQKEQTAIKIANYQANISEEDFRETVIKVTNRVAEAYWKLYLFKELVGINQKNFDMAEEVYRRESERLERGISQKLDAERARSNAETRRSTLLLSQQEYRVAMDRLKLLLNRGQFQLDFDSEVMPIEIPKTQPVVVDENEAIATALENRSEIVKTLQEKLIRQADEDLAAHQRLPELDVVGRYSLSGYGDDFSDATNDMDFNSDDAWEVGLKFKWPIGNRAANSRYREKILKRQQVEALLKRVENDIKLDVKQILHGIAIARGEIEATRLAKAAAEKVVEGEFTRFDIGQTSNEELLRAQDLLALTSRSYSRAVVNYNIALHDLARAQGVLPDGVTIEEARR